MRAACSGPLKHIVGAATGFVRPAGQNVGFDLLLKQTAAGRLAARLRSRSLPAKLELALTFVERLIQEVLMFCLSVVLVVCCGAASGSTASGLRKVARRAASSPEGRGQPRVARLQSVGSSGHRRSRTQAGGRAFRTREADLVRRVLTLAKDHPDATEAPPLWTGRSGSSGRIFQKASRNATPSARP